VAPFAPATVVSAGGELIPEADPATAEPLPPRVVGPLGVTVATAVLVAPVSVYSDGNARRADVPWQPIPTARGIPGYALSILDIVGVVPVPGYYPIRRRSASRTP
jgi:hypothetical protein